MTDESIYLIAECSKNNESYELYQLYYRLTKSASSDSISIRMRYDNPFMMNFDYTCSLSHNKELTQQVWDYFSTHNRLSCLNNRELFELLKVPISANLRFVMKSTKERVNQLLQDAWNNTP